MSSEDTDAIVVAAMLMMFCFGITALGKGGLVLVEKRNIQTISIDGMIYNGQSSAQNLIQVINTSQPDEFNSEEDVSSYEACP